MADMVLSLAELVDNLDVLMDEIEVDPDKVVIVEAEDGKRFVLVSHSWYERANGTLHLQSPGDAPQLNE
jgi:PHD/YefM family antitoxin component YafN of YafNO toxin-antitoxin module